MGVRMGAQNQQKFAKKHEKAAREAFQERHLYHITEKLASKPSVEPPSMDSVW